MDVKEALTRDLREKCPACEGTGQVPSTSFVDSSKTIRRTCRICKGLKSLSIHEEDLVAMVETLRRELDEISNIVSSDHDVVTRLLSRESLTIDS